MGKIAFKQGHLRLLSCTVLVMTTYGAIAQVKTAIPGDPITVDTGNPSTSAVKVPRYELKHEPRVVFGDTISIEKLNTEQIEFLRAHAPKRGGGSGPVPSPRPGLQ